jgi:hypothetical protein
MYLDHPDLEFKSAPNVPARRADLVTERRAKASRSRARLDANREFRAARKDSYLASLLRRWAPDEMAGT